MSWKSLVTVGLFCLLAAPAFANPNMAIVSNTGTTGTGGTSGHLDASGNWVWTVTVTPDVSMVPDTTGTPVGAELGFTSSSTRSGDVPGQGNLLSATNASTGANDKFDTINPGAVIFGSFQTSTNGLLDTASNNRPTGIQTSCAAGNCSNQSYTTPAGLGGDSSVTNTAANAQQVFAALGSINFTAANTPQAFINIKTKGPVVTTANITTTATIQTSGVYGTGSTNGRLTQVTGKSGSTYTTSNFDTFGGTSYSFTMTAKGGDADLNGSDNGADFAAVLNHLNVPGTWTWAEGDFDGNGAVNGADFAMVLNNLNVGAFNYTVGPVSPGAGAGGLTTGGVGVPEPASAALLGLALLGSLGMIRRKR